MARERKDIYPQVPHWKKWGPPAAIALLFVGLLAWRVLQKPPPPQLPAQPVQSFEKKAPGAAPRAAGAKKAGNDDLLAARSGAVKEGSPGLSPSFGGGEAGRRGQAPASPAEENKRWLARWFPGLAELAGSGAGADTKAGAAGGSSPSPRGSSPGPGFGSSGGGGGGLPASLAGAQGKNFGLKEPHELGPGGGQAGERKTFVDDTFAENNRLVAGEFRENARLEVPQIPGSQYLKLDLDDGFEGINIFQGQQGTNVSILAKAGTVTQAQLEAFLQEAGEWGIPALLGVVAPASLGAPNVIPAPAGSGLKDAKAWQFTSNGRTVQLALMERADAQGTYLCIVNAPGENVAGAEDFYAKYFEQLKAI